jgi:glycosyltransferase involved in cell wall biosynthesis
MSTDQFAWPDRRIASPRLRAVAADVHLTSTATFGAPTISTVIPAYNAQLFLSRAIDSALAQDIPHSEIIVVDDASADATGEIVRSYEARGVRLISHAQRRGAAAARNTGVAAAKGEYVAFLDADDEWLPGKLRRQLDILSANPAMSFISCRAALVDEIGREIDDIYRGAPPAVGHDAWRTLLAHPCVATPSVLARRSSLLATGPFNRWMPVGEDQDMWIRLSLIGEVGHLPETLVRVHSTPHSLSKRSFKEQASYVLPMVAAYLARYGERLTSVERRRILGERLGKMGQFAYANGELDFGLLTLLRAIARGYQPLPNLLYLVRASAPIRRLKQILLHTKIGHL